MEPRWPNCLVRKIKKRKDESTSSITSSNWWTPTFIITSYLAALLVALMHLCLFKFLDGKIADGVDRKAPQTYVTSASQVLASTFQICLQASLSTAFVQHLWYTIRRLTLAVSTIDSLFLIRSEPLSFKWSALRAAPQLVCLVVLIWAIHVATIFPPGALTVGLVQHYATAIPISVPTFNASYMGNGSLVYADKYSLDRIETEFQGPVGQGANLAYITSESLVSGEFPQTLQHLANEITASGDHFGMVSPCGPNCSYTTTFDGPYFLCNTSTANITFYDDSWWDIDDPFKMYNGSYYSLGTDSSSSDIDNDVWPNNYPSIFQSTLWSPIAINSLYNENAHALIAMQQNLTCFPFRAEYVIYNRYQDNIQCLNVSTRPIQPLNSFSDANVTGLIQYVTLTPSESANSAIIDGNEVDSTVAINWTSIGLQRYRDLNLMYLINAVATSLSGEYNVNDAFPLTDYNVTLPGYRDTLWSLDAVWDGDTSLPGGLGGLESRLNDNIRLGFLHNSGTLPGILQFYKNYEGISFTITLDLLNELLMNATISAITSYGLWNTTVNATIESLISTYQFSAPINLILPYCLSLLIALPFALLGLRALHKNGFSANDGGFLGLITTTRSHSLEREAAVGSLGANAPPKLQDLKVRFGELIDRGEKGKRNRGDKVAKIAGFGTEDETLPLERGSSYGRPSIVNTRTGWI